MKYDYRKTRAGRRRILYPVIYNLTFTLQNLLFKIGISWHNKFSDECAPDFSCCSNYKKDHLEFK